MSGILCSMVGASFSAPPVVLSYSYFSDTYATLSTTITMPSSIQANDLAVMFDWQCNGTTTVPTAVTPTGWTNIINSIQSATLSGQRNCISYKKLDGSEGGTSITGMTQGGLRGEKKIVVFRPTKAITSVTITSLNGQATTNAPTNQSLVLGSSSSGAPYIGFAWYASTGSITTRGSTTTETREIGTSGTTPRGFLKTFESTSPSISFSNSTISMADYGVNSMISFKMILG